MRHWLERNGVPAQVRDARLGLAGEIPVADASPTLWVADELAEKATDLVRAFEQPTLVHPPWTCPNCGEPNEPTFGECWNCQTDAP